MKKVFFIFLIFSHFAYAMDLQEDLFEELDAQYNQEAKKISDPLEGYNRFMTDINWAFYDYVVSPSTEIYSKVTPNGLRIGIYNFFDNLSSPLRFLSALFSWHIQDALDEFGRFALNTTFGFGGVFDIATANELYAHDADFGVLFGRYGIKSGPHIVLPIFGPRNLRDALSMPLNTLASPTTYLDSLTLSTSAYIVRGINYTARHKKTLDTFRADSLDTYILMRDAYEQRREALIKE